MDSTETMMKDWDQVVVFGARPEVAACVIRPSAYGLITDSHGRLAVVRTNRGTFLPGGGIEAGETPQATIMRETLEECGLVIQPGVWSVRAVQFVYSEPEKTHFEKRSIFIEGTVVGSASIQLEADHKLAWVTLETATQTLSHQSQSWAAERWRSR